MVEPWYRGHCVRCDELTVRVTLGLGYRRGG